MSNRRWGRGGNQTQSHSLLSGVLGKGTGKAYGAYARRHENSSPVKRAFVAGRVSAANRNKKITLATTPFDCSEES